MSEYSRTGSILAFDAQWQTPAITEQHSFNRLRNLGWSSTDASYFAFPWASLIDGIKRDTELGHRLQERLASMPPLNGTDRIITVCQHIKFREFMEEFRRAGVTDLFASHAMRGERVIDGINIHPYPLFPVQVPEEPLWEDPAERRLTNFLARRHLYSFMGAFDPRYYLTRSREWIFNLPQTDRGLIVNRNAWHFEHRVYQEQVHGQEVCPTVLSEEERNALEFKRVMRETQFSLCPSGTGPNSIRLWESIEFGCIPVILADDLRLPGERRLWERACVIVEEQEAAINEIPRLLGSLLENPGGIADKLEALDTLRRRYGRDSFVHDIVHASSPAAASWLPDVRTTRRPHRFFLSVQQVDDAVAHAWIDWLRDLCGALGIRALVCLDRELGDAARTGAATGGSLRVVAGDGAFPLHHDWSREDLVTVSDSRVLSRGLLERFDRFHVRCHAPPAAINASLADLFEIEARRRRQEEGAAPAGAPALTTWRPKCTLVTSMYDGDEFARGFLENCGALVDYDDIEHLVVRPASPGREHTALSKHVDRHPNTVYIWLHEDPRLYEVWNLCCRLATAPYLSNANIDDRRAPEHVLRLTRVLDENPDVDVASSALRVTATRNLAWEDSGECEAWYANEPSEKYTVERLLKQRDGQFVAYNAPHCMPVWRRSVHAWNGWFDERRFGPSADWEFWLRAGTGGAKFFILGEPLGLYLRSESSYWRRETAASAFDQRIVATYTDAAGELRLIGPQQSISARVDQAIDSRRRGDWLRYFWCLFDLLEQTRRDDHPSPTLRQIVDTLCRRDLGVQESVLLKRPDAEAGAADESPTDLSTVLRLLVDALHEAASKEIRGTARVEAPRRALDQLIDLAGGSEAMLARAFVAHLEQDRVAEAHYLSRAHATGEADFWPRLQAAYRFTRPLRELCEDIGGLPAFTELEEVKAGQTIFFFPDYSHGNPYQKLLYAGLEARGVRTVGVNDLSALTDGTQTFAAGDVLHVHWFNILHKGVEPAHHAEVLDRFLAQVDQLKAAGMRLFWTVHNRYSHDLDDVSVEREFQRALCRRADLVLLHHPCLVEELSDWLTEDAPVRFLEHGNYIGVYENEITQEDARRSLGLDADDRVIAVIGQVRPYKGLAEVLPVLRDAMRDNPRLKLVLAGKIACEATREELAKMPEGQLVVRDAFIDDSEFQLYLNAADFVLLCYRDILTSGSLFQAFSFGKPVIAPRLGSIPTYVLHGWNGLCFDTEHQLVAELNRVIRFRAKGLASLSEHATASAQLLSWPRA